MHFFNSNLTKLEYIDIKYLGIPPMGRSHLQGNQKGYSCRAYKRLTSKRAVYTTISSDSESCPTLTGVTDSI